MVWYAFYDLQPGNEQASVLVIQPPEPVRGREVRIGLVYWALRLRRIIGEPAGTGSCPH